MIEIEITNPLPDDGVAAATAGNRMALLNIRERFRLAWRGRAAVEFGRAGDEYRVCLRFPAGEGLSRSARPELPSA